MNVTVRLDRSFTSVAQRRDLSWDLVERPRRPSDGASRVQSRPQVSAHRILRTPPRVECAEAILGCVDLPIELRREIIDPSLAQPFSSVGIRLLEGVEPVDAFRRSGTPDTERTDSHRHPWLRDVNTLIKRRDKIVDVVTPPIVAIRPALSASVLDPRGTIREVELVHDSDRVAMAPATYPPIVRARLPIGIKEVVEMHRIDVISLNDVDDGREDRLPRRGDAGIDPLLSAIASNPLVMNSRDVVTRGSNAAVERCAKRIEPCMHLEPARMRLAHDHGERIVARVHSLSASQLRRPGCERGLVQRVATQPNVKDDRIEANPPRAIQQRDELTLLLLRGESGTGRPIAVRGRAQPSTSKLAKDDRRKNRAVAQGDARHVARCALRNHALGPSPARAAEE